MDGGIGIGDHGCERARAWASLQLDGELSQLEGALLDVHLRRCPACSAAVNESAAATQLLRAAPLEQPSRPLVAPSERRPARARPLALRLALAATLAALAAGLGVLAGSVGGDSPTRSPLPAADIAFLPTADEERDDRRGLRRQPSEPLVQPLAPSRVGLSGV